MSEERERERERVSRQDAKGRKSRSIFCNYFNGSTWTISFFFLEEGENHSVSPEVKTSEALCSIGKLKNTLRLSSLSVFA